MKIVYETCVTDTFLDDKSFICLDLVDIKDIEKYKDEIIIPFVSHQTRNKLEKNNFKLIIGDHPEQYTTKFLLSHFNRFTLTGDMVLLPFGAILNGFRGDEFFIRPNAGNKYFPGCTVKYDEFGIFKQTYNIPDDLLCARSSTVDIISEKRSFIDVQNTKIITESLYSHNKGVIDGIDFCIEDNVNQIFNSMEKHLLPDIVVADFALLDSGEVKLIEFNCAMTSGLYNCDINKIIDFYSKEIINARY